MVRVTILHPDLGIGGAERLIVDAAVGLRDRGHSVRIFTNQYDKEHCFRETHDLDICTVVPWMPRSIFGKAHALCAYLKMMIAALYVCFFHPDTDIFLSDTVSASQFVLKLFSSAKLIFYCHFPDQLLTKSEGAGKKAYRRMIDAVEEYTTSLADVICVNSKFTRDVVRRTFRTMTDREFTVLYPSLNTEFFDSIEVTEDIGAEIPNDAKFVFTSLNRFERKKNVKLALDAFANLKTLISADEFAQCHLVIAGGYDRRNTENIEHFAELVEHVAELSLPVQQITFIKSPSDEQKVNLIRRSRAMLYTPDREHFGIVPVEAMYLGTPVIAVNTGGPCESVRHNETGYLVDQTPKAFSQKMAELLKNEQKWLELSEEGPRWVQQVFAFDAFARKLDEIVQSVL